MYIKAAALDFAALNASMHRVLWGIAVGIVLIDCVWAAAAHFSLDGKGYLFVGEVTTALAGLGLFYGQVRRDDRLSTMLSATAFLTVFSAAFAAFNYMLL